MQCELGCMSYDVFLRAQAARAVHGLLGAHAGVQIHGAMPQSLVFVVPKSWSGVCVFFFRSVSWCFICQMPSVRCACFCCFCFSPDAKGSCAPACVRSFRAGVRGEQEWHPFDADTGVAPGLPLSLDC